MRNSLKMMILTVSLSILDGASCGARPLSVGATVDPVLLIETARSMLARQEYDTAIVAMDQAIAEFPRSGDAFQLRGNAQFAKKNYAGAASDLIKAHDLYNVAAKQMFGHYEIASTAARHTDATEALDAYVVLTKKAAAVMEELTLADVEVAKHVAGSWPAEQARADRKMRDEIVKQRRLGSVTW